MPDLEAFGADPHIALRFTNTADTVGDFRLVRTSAGLQVRAWTGAAWVTRLTFSASEIEASGSLRFDQPGLPTELPTLQWSDTAGGGRTYRMVQDARELKLQSVVGTTPADVLVFSADDFVYARNGLTAGTTAPVHAIRWRQYQFRALDPGGLQRLFLHTSTKVLSAYVTLAPTYLATLQDHSSLSPGLAYTGFRVQVKRSVAPAVDEVQITYDTTTYASGWFRALVFFQA